MNTFEQEMHKLQEKLEKDMNIIASLFLNIKRKSYLGDNNMLLDFNRKEFEEAITASLNFDSHKEIPGAFTHKGIEFRMNTYPKTNRIAFTF